VLTVTFGGGAAVGAGLRQALIRKTEPRQATMRFYETNSSVYSQIKTTSRASRFAPGNYFNTKLLI